MTGETSLVWALKGKVTIFQECLQPEIRFSCRDQSSVDTATNSSLELV